MDFTRGFVLKLGLCAALCYGLLAQNAHAVDIGALPRYVADEAAYSGDWLVKRPEQKAQLYRTGKAGEIVLSNGLLSRTFRLSPNCATVGLEHLVTGVSLLRGVKPEALVEIDGTAYEVGGLKGQPNYAFLRREWVDALENNPEAMQFAGLEMGEPKERFAWKRVRRHAPDAVWPPKGVYLRMDYRMPEGAKAPEVLVSVHYELYDGIPLLCKWITVKNEGRHAIRLNRFTSEILAAVELGSNVEDREIALPAPNIHVEAEYSFGGMSTWNTTRFAVHWVPDPEYATQVNYQRRTPCLLEVRPEIGPDEEVAPGGSFESFRAYVLPFDGYDRERNGLAQRRMYRTIAPWTTENPLMMHVRYADWKAVQSAIDQCAEVGFEMVILTFGSGFDVENEHKGNLRKARRYADYAQSKGIEIGSYSLLASRKVGGGNDVVMPEGETPTFGNSPCLLSPWGLDYFRKLRQFYRESGFSLLEHDGSYPGDVCISTEHPGHEGHGDSRWKQWRSISDFYKWCRGRGIYLNVPDYYYVAGSNKCGMGYRETNWSLPRAQQVIHTRQNIFDGTWEKTPSMGWMFVPLTEYHGGGAAATIEPLDEHLDHYERMLYSNLALGVQACYRGPRLYDTDRTQAMVKQWVDWFKKYRDILESDIVHGRRADGLGLDWMLHVNPELMQKGLLAVFNPLDEELQRTLKLNLYYTGLEDTARIREGEGPSREFALARDYSVSLDVTVPAQGFAWYVIE